MLYMCVHVIVCRQINSIFQGVLINAFMWHLIKIGQKHANLINVFDTLFVGLHSVQYCAQCVHADAHTDGGPLNEDDNVAADHRGGEGENPRRSSSMDCLSDPDLWPRSLSSTNQVRDNIQTKIHT